MQVEIRPGERIDDLQVGGFRLIQRPGSFCFGTDAVLLADFAAPRRKDNAADLGTGTGIVAVLMAAHQPTLSVDAVEIQGEMAEMARRSVQLNELQDRVFVYHCDMRTAWQTIGQGGKSLVTCNPPYGKRNSGPVSEADPQRIARHEDDLTVDDVAASAARLLRFGGRFCVVFPAPRALEMMHAMQARQLEPKRIRSVHARPSKAPKLVLIEAVKGAHSGLNWLAPLYLADENGAPSPEYRRIYRLPE